MSKSPFAIPGRGSKSFLSTTPTNVPAMSNAPGAYTPGISAVSPPSNTQSPAAHASDMPDTTSATISALICDDAK